MNYDCCLWDPIKGCHDLCDGKPVYNWLIGILSAGEGHHDVHHANPGQVQLSKYDFAGLVAKKLFI